MNYDGSQFDFWVILKKKFFI